MVEKQDPWIGVTLQNSTSQTSYLLQKKLGEGAFGAVYQALEQPSGKKTAVKLLHAKHSQNKSLSVRFLQEEQIANRLEHPDAVMFYASGETQDGTLWLAMEFVPGEPLDEYLRRRGALSVKETLTILGPVCEVLDEAHKKGIIHRDLKPQNMMVVELGKRLVVKVLDFGIAKCTGSEVESQTGVAMGTPMYMPPEQWESAKKVTAASDIYSLGIIAYQCLSGQLPLKADSLPGWVKAHTQDPPEPLQKVTQGRLPRALCEVVMQAIEKDPEVRFSSAMALKNALEEAAKGSPSSSAETVAASLPPQAAVAKVDIATAKLAPRPPSKSRFWWGPALLGLGVLVYLSIRPEQAQMSPPASQQLVPAVKKESATTSTAPVIKPVEPCYQTELRNLKPDYREGEKVEFSIRSITTTPIQLTILGVQKDGTLDVLSPSKILPQIELLPGQAIDIPTQEMKKEKLVLKARAKGKEGWGEGVLVLSGERAESPEVLAKLEAPKSGEPQVVGDAVQRWRAQLNSLCYEYRYYFIFD